jgi:hypothetical protein
MVPNRSVSLIAFLFAATIAELAVSTCWARAPLPIRRFDVEGTIARIVPATGDQKKDGILATVTLKGQDLTIQITRDTPLQRQNGKLVDDITVDALQKGAKVSIWLKDKPEKSASTVKAEGVLVFPG